MKDSHFSTLNSMNTADQYDQIMNYARRLYAERPDWSHFFRDVLGIRGIVRRTLGSESEVSHFEQSEDYLDLLKMLTSLRMHETGTVEAIEPEPTKVITVRLPKSVHERLRDEAFQRRTSMNKLCISKLVQYINDDLVPEDL